MEKNSKLDCGKRIFYLRKKMGLTRAKFEEITGMSSRTLRSLEIGERVLSPSKAILVCNLFKYVLKLDDEDVNPDFLLYGRKNDAHR